ncbi:MULTISPECIES: hypothetical protein [Raoultella]|uniref:Uncharacterized protein n=1 Tax=Raoultella lignicola TaxID=3040939 RepID=A0ABU9F3K3_9ENTR|nr:hypothetical protein [Raoultella sp. RIT712]MRT51049.1 hypothetical protein [Raoultella sp. RIT712]
MTLYKRWGYLLFFMLLSAFSAGNSASAHLIIAPVAITISAICPAPAAWTRSGLQQRLFNRQSTLATLHQLREKLQQNSLSIQVYDRLWTAYQWNLMLLELNPLCVNYARRALYCPEAYPSLLRKLYPAD